MAVVFISYRRKGALKDARALYERLRHDVGKDNIFMDLEGIEMGADFVEVLERQLNGCRIMLAVIDPTWATMTDAKGRRRIDREDDFVRLEIAAALQRKIAVIPVLIDDAEMPDKADLPEDLRPLTTRQGMSLDFRRFDAEMGRLVASLHKLLKRGQTDKGPPSNAPAPARPRQRRKREALDSAQGAAPPDDRGDAPEKRVTGLLARTRLANVIQGWHLHEPFPPQRVTTLDGLPPAMLVSMGGRRLQTHESVEAAAYSSLGRGRLDDALEQYSTIVEQLGGPDDLIARALFNRGWINWEVQRRLGVLVDERWQKASEDFLAVCQLRSAFPEVATAANDAFSLLSQAKALAVRDGRATL